MRTRGAAIESPRQAGRGFDHRRLRIQRRDEAGVSCRLPVHAYGHPGNHGEGIKLAQDVGADLWHMRAVAAPLGFKFLEYESAFIMKMPADGYIL